MAGRLELPQSNAGTLGSFQEEGRHRLAPSPHSAPATTTAGGCCEGDGGGSGFDVACCQSPMDRFFDGTPKSFFNAGQAWPVASPAVVGGGAAVEVKLGQSQAAGPPTAAAAAGAVGASVPQFGGPVGFSGWAAGAQGPVFFCPAGSGMALAPMGPTMPMAIAAMPMPLPPPSIGAAANNTAGTVVAATGATPAANGMPPHLAAAAQQPARTATQPSGTFLPTLLPSSQARASKTSSEVTTQLRAAFAAASQQPLPLRRAARRRLQQQLGSRGDERTAGPRCPQQSMLT